ncbi:hypothetical protein Tco_0271401 [Tanacetum coccineum]
MTSFDFVFRLNPIYAIKECSSCGSLYTSNCGCSKGSLEDKILVPKPPRNCARCAKCGTPVDGPYCQGCALLRKEFMEGLFTNCVENEFFKDFQDTSESSDDNTNVVNAPREPIVVNQDPGKNSSPSPPHIDHCCHECGDSLDGIFCRQCTCKSCGKGAHYGYNCPPKVPIISNPGPCKNQTIDEPLQNLQGLQQQCLLGTCQRCGCNEYDGVCFYCKVGNGTQINDLTPHFSNDSPSVANHPPQPQYVPYSRELCGNDSHYSYDCPPQVPFFPPTDRSDLNHEEFADELAHIISPPEYDHFCFKIEPELGNLTMDVVNDIFPTREPRVHVPNVLTTHPTLDTDFILLSEPLFAYIVWIFLPFLTYPVAPPYLLSCGNEDIIFDPGISNYHSFMPDVSHRSGTFMKFNVYPNHLNESPMMILPSTCFPMDQ